MFLLISFLLYIFNLFSLAERFKQTVWVYYKNIKETNTFFLRFCQVCSIDYSY